MKQPRSIAARRLLSEIGVPLLLLGALDLGLGWYVARTPSVPPPRLFGGDPIMSGKFLALRTRALSPPTLDVLLLGMSQMMRVDGHQLEAELGESTQRPVRVFNLAGPYHSFASDQRLVGDLILPLARPRVIVYGLTPNALLNELLTLQQVDALYDERPIFGLYAGSPLARARGFAAMHLNLWKYRGVIHDALQLPLGWKEVPFGAQARAVNSTGDIPLLNRHIPVKGLHLGERKSQRRFADFDAVLRRTLLFGNIARFAEFCRRNEIELVLFNTPVHPFFMQLFPNGAHDYERYRARLREVAAEQGLRLFEPVDDGVGSPELFNDTVHLNPAGGAWLTGELATYLVGAELVTSRTTAGAQSGSGRDGVQATRGRGSRHGALAGPGPAP